MNYSYQDYKDKLDEIFNQYSDKSAIVNLNEDGTRTTLRYSDVLNIVNNIREMLLKSGLKKADRIAVVSQHTPYAVILNLSLAYLGYTAVLIDASLPPVEQNRLIDYSDVSALFTTMPVYEKLNKSNFKGIPIFEICSDFTYKLFKDSAKCVDQVATEPTNEEIIAIIFSSGTTGSMKGVQVTYNSIIYAHTYMIEYTNLNYWISFLDVLPSNHIAGYSSSMSCFLSGAEIGFITEMNAENLTKGFLEYNPTNFIMIPKIYEIIKNKIIESINQKPAIIKFYANIALRISSIVRRLTGIKIRFLTKPIIKAALGRNMTICGCGTAPCSEDIIKFYLDLGINFVNVYGATETGFPICAANCNDKYPCKGVGKIDQFQEIQIIIHMPDSNGIGEIRIKTPLIMYGYFKDSEQTLESFDENGYFKTGDYGYIDKKGYLYITGRIKESIVLQNGKKVSPSDVDDYYLSKISYYNIASRGIVNEKGQYDEIHMFVANKDYTVEEQQTIRASLLELSKNAPSMYRLSNIHFISDIPKTSVGKVKRFCLTVDSKNQIMPNANNASSNKHKFDNQSILDTIITIISTINNIEPKNIKSDMRLKEDIGMDSLGIFEMCVELDEKYNVSIESHLQNDITVAEIVNIIETRSSISNSAENIAEYPLKRTEKDYKNFDRFMRLSKSIYNFYVTGTEHINPNENYIFCPNHESHFDGMWIIGNLDNTIKQSICSAAADYLFEKKIYRMGLIFMGGIPVHRSGNTSTALKRAYECITKDGYSLMIHPEGTRTRNGELGEFKQGAAKLSIESGVKIIPVCINGAREIFPPDRKFPHLFDWKHFRKYPLQIQFGVPIAPDDKTAAEITAVIRKQIVDMKNVLKG